mgnify:CR=1 FL=1
MSLINKSLYAIGGVILGAVVSLTQLGCMGDQFGGRRLSEIVGSRAPNACPIFLAPLYDGPALIRVESSEPRIIVIDGKQYRRQD